MPTGSMAPTLLGDHEEIVCPNCGIRFALGLDEEGRPGRPVCPNCGTADLDGAPAVECSGDRVLVQKFLYDFRRPAALGGRGLPLPGRAVAGLRQARGRACPASRSRSSGATS